MKAVSFIALCVFLSSSAFADSPPLVTKCIPAAFSALSSIFGSNNVSADAVGAVCAGGNTAAQVTTCIPAAFSALSNIFGSNDLGAGAVGTACAGGNTAAQVTSCIPAAFSALSSIFGSNDTAAAAVAKSCSNIAHLSGLNLNGSEDL